MNKFVFVSHGISQMSLVEEAAILTTTLLIGLAVFQALLIAGFPLGNFAWGGGYKVLPARLRVGSVIAIIIYVIFAVILLGKANIVSILPSKSIADVGIWIITVLLFISTILNALSHSKNEKLVMIPINLLLSCLCLYVALQ